MDHYASRKDILIASVDCQTDKAKFFKSCPPNCKPGSGASLCDHFGITKKGEKIKGFPTLLYGQKSDESSLGEYGGNHDYKSLLAFAQSHLEPGPSPPGPSPPHPSKPHYGKPPCNADETAITVGHENQVCAPACSDSCPADTPSGEAAPACGEKGSRFEQYCVITCLFDSQCDTGGGATCVDQPGTKGICAYHSSITV